MSSAGSSATTAEGVTDRCFYCEAPGAACNLRIFRCPTTRCPECKPIALCPICLGHSACRGCKRKPTVEDHRPYDTDSHSDGLAGALGNEDWESSWGTMSSGDEARRHLLQDRQETSLQRLPEESPSSPGARGSADPPPAEDLLLAHRTPETVRVAPTAGQLGGDFATAGTPYVPRRASLRNQPSDVIVIHVVEYKRSPARFLASVLLSPELAQCRQAMENTDPDFFGEGGPKLFVLPEHVGPVIDHLISSGVVFGDGSRIFLADMRPRHVIYSEEFDGAIQNAIARRRGSGRDGGTGREKVKPKRTTSFDLLVRRNPDAYPDTAPLPEDNDSRHIVDLVTPSTEEDETDQEPQDERQEVRQDDPQEDGLEEQQDERQEIPYIVKHTFIHVRLPSSLWSGMSSGPKTASTTDAHDGTNPRKRRKVAFEQLGSSQSLCQDQSSQSQSLPPISMLGLSPDGSSQSQDPRR